MEKRRGVGGRKKNALKFTRFQVEMGIAKENNFFGGIKNRTKIKRENGRNTYAALRI